MAGKPTKSYMGKGFTLIELLVVISVIALLMAILMPALRKAKEQTRLVICASNQHQLVIGLQTYSSAHDGILPPHATKGARPNLLARNQYIKDGDDYQYRYLGAYFPEVDIFNCPLSGFKPDTVWEIGGAQYTYQELYENKDNWFDSIQNMHVSCSYNLYWNYERYFNYPAFNCDRNPNNRIPPKPFRGPGRKSENTLLVSDAFYFSNKLGSDVGVGNRWTCNHRFNGSSKQASKYYPYYIANIAGTEADLDTNNDLQRIPLNAGYLDGHVRRYRSGDTVRQQALDGWAASYIPPPDMW